MSVTAQVDSAPAFAHAEHEARHVVGGWFGGQEVRSAAIGSHAPVDAAGNVKTVPSENGVAELLGRLLGWLNDPDLPEGAVWPPPYPPPVGKGRDPDGVGWCVRHFGLSKRAYEQTCELAGELAADPDSQRAVALVARGLLAAPQLDYEGLEILRVASGFGDEEEET